MRYAFSLTLLYLSTIIYAQHWSVSELSPMPEAISNNAVCEGFVNGVPYVYTFSGIDETKEYSGIHNRAYRYNTQTDSWESIQPLPDPMGKIAASANRIGDIIYIIGGYYVFGDGTEVSSDRVHRYHTQTNSYLSDGAPIPVAIDDQVQVVYKDSLIYVITGWNDTQNVTNVQVYDPSLDQWQQATPLSAAQTPVFGAAGSIIGDTIYFFGGARNGTFSIQAKLRKGAINPNDPLDIEWSNKSLGNVAYRPASVTDGQHLYILGGADQTYNFNGLAYSNGQGVNPNNRSLVYRPLDGFKEADESNVLPMDLRGVANVGDSLKYLAGGMLAGQMVTNKLWKLELLGVPTSIKEPLIDPDIVDIFPNPAKDFLRIEIKNGLDCSQIELALFDQNGKQLSQESKDDCQFSIEVSGLVPGVYQLLIGDGQQQITKTFLKQ